MGSQCSLPKLEMIQLKWRKEDTKPSKLIEMHFFAGDFCICAECSLEIQIMYNYIKKSQISY